jgi:hypothetical protein
VTNKIRLVWLLKASHVLIALAEIFCISGFTEKLLGTRTTSTEYSIFDVIYTDGNGFKSFTYRKTLYNFVEDKLKKKYMHLYEQEHSKM